MLAPALPAAAGRGDVLASGRCTAVVVPQALVQDLGQDGAAVLGVEREARGLFKDGTNLDQAVRPRLALGRRLPLLELPDLLLDRRSLGGLLLRKIGRASCRERV